jgi:HlyD family secretion protein
MKYVVGLVLLLAVVGGVIFWYVREAKGASEVPPPSAKVERGDLRVFVEATGSVASNNDVDIKCRASGEVQYLPYDISDDVPQGAIVMKLDTTDQDRALAQADAQLAYDKARLEEAKLAWEVAKLNLQTTRQRAEATLASTEAKAADNVAKRDRTQALFEAKLTSKEDLETAQTAALQSAAEVQLAKAAVAELDQQKLQVDSKFQDIELVKQQMAQDQAKRDVAYNAVTYCEVKAPEIKNLAGEKVADAKWRVSALTVKIGTLVQSGTSNVSGGTSVMTLSDLSHIYVMATVDESDIGQVEKGQFVDITSDSFKGVKFEGKVVRIATKGVSTSNVVTFEVKIEVTSPNRMLLKPMMTTNVDIISNEKKNVLLLPMNAVSRRHAGPENTTMASTEEVTDDSASETPTTPKAGKRGKHGGEHRPQVASTTPGTVTVLKPDGTKETRDVLIGMDDEVHYEIIKGVEEGETVLLNKAGANSRFANNGRRSRGGR